MDEPTSSSVIKNKIYNCALDIAMKPEAIRAISSVPNKGLMVFQKLEMLLTIASTEMTAVRL
ncbi:MAG: hypothetical protein GY759_10115 [Chloroflexi bacterium]|nr:hypothetical protein [Chloroflexota bacterium]